MAKYLNDIIEKYINGSFIKEINYSNLTKKYTITYTYNVSDDVFDNAEDMIAFLEADQNNQ